MQSWPRLRDHLGPLVRPDGTVQFGLDPAAGLRIAGLSEAEVGWVRALDGGTDPVADGIRRGLDRTRLHEVLELLGRAGVLTRPGRAVGAARGVGAAGARVWIEGSGGAGRRLADLLNRAGVAQVAQLPAGGAVPSYRRRPDVVVLVTSGPALATDATRWRERGVPHLPLATGQPGLSIGPLVIPGRGPCLRCADLARADRDPFWPWVAAQARSAGSGERADEAACAIAAGLAARLILARLAGESVPDGLTLEVSSPWPAVRLHRWATHPNCGACWADPADARTMGG